MQKKPPKSEDFLSQIEKTIADVFYLYNIEEDRYEFMSANAKKVTGADPQFYYRGKDYVKKFIYPDDRAATSKAYKDVIIKKESQKINFRIVNQGKVRWLHEEFFPILNKSGEVAKVSGVITDVTEKVTRERELESIQENTKLLSEIGHEIGEHLNVKSIVKSIYNRLNKMMYAEIFGIGIVNAENNCIDFPYFLENQIEMTTSMSLDSNVLSAICVKNDSSIVINDLNIDLPKYTNEPLGKTTGDEPRSILYIPLRANNKVIGVITVQSRKPKAYSITDIQLLKNLSVYVSRSIINANLYESMEHVIEDRTREVIQQKKALEKAYHNAALLSEIGTDISLSLKFDEIFDKLHRNLAKLLDAEIFGVRTLNKKEQNILYQFEFESGKRADAFTVPLSDVDNYTVWCVTNNKDIYINDNLIDYKNYVSEIKVPAGLMPESLIFVPIVHHNEVLGAITVQSFKKNAYSKEHLNVMKTLAFYTGIAIANASLYHSLEKKVEERTQELKQANKSVMDSINYTKNIQDATLTRESEIKKLLPKSFIYFKPRDIVSGDFYRVDTVVNSKDEELISILIADCTGHGVPGATLAILCSSIIKQSYAESTVDSPSDSLNFARKSLVDLFDKSEDTIYDGMDVSLGVLNPKTREFYFSGAFNNCYILREGELIVLKGNRMHVGYSEKQKDFTTQKVQLYKKDFIVFSTDGYLDQFGGDRYKKIGRKRFLELIANIVNLEPEHQLGRINKQFQEWKGSNEQTDDVCTFGFTVE